MYQKYSILYLGLRQNNKGGVELNGIKRARKTKFLTQKQLAEKMEVHINTIKLWENGGMKITSDKLIKLSEILETEINDLLKEYPN